ncbi:MAG: hypothetical protein F9K19_12920 [Rhizobiaceae bacterium]|nr:MAG: hypothetical protein F9K19_12920 [Rhizobiaceae bacterium]CAG1015904.1 hypothetical protein RHIZO_05196 [Rhizobiaceae bacterium]
MDVIETAIRNAFDKGDATDRAFRERVYRAAFAALERALKANPNVTVETAINRRKNLQAKIVEIESEFVPAAPAVAPDVRAAERALEDVRIEPPHAAAGSPAPSTAPSVSLGDTARERQAAPEVSAAPPAAPSGRHAAPGPSVAPDSGDRSQAEPVLAGSPQFDPRAERAAPAPGAEAAVPAQVERVVDDRRRRPFAAMFVIVTLAAAIGAGVWWGMSTGLFKSLAELDTSVPNPPQVAAEEDFDPDEEPIGAPSLPGAADAGRDWIGVFSPDDASTVAAPGGTEAAAMNDDTGAFLRVRSTSDAAVVFDVGQGVLERLAGKRVVFAIVARAEEGKETQISISCNFGELGGCGRKRYAVGYERGDFLFEVAFPAKQPGAAGTIAIVSDIGGEGKAIDIYEIKASPAE